MGGVLLVKIDPQIITFFTPFMKLEIYRSPRNDDVWISFYTFDDELLETKIILDKDTTPLKIESIFEEG